MQKICNFINTYLSICSLQHKTFQSCIGGTLHSNINAEKLLYSNLIFADVIIKKKDFFAFDFLLIPLFPLRCIWNPDPEPFINDRMSVLSGYVHVYLCLDTADVNISMCIFMPPP